MNDLTHYGYEQSEEMEVELAGGWERIGAVLLNGVFYVLSFIPLIIALVAFQTDGKPSPMGLLFLLVPLGLQIYQLVLLCKHGYTLGKKLLGIQVVKRDGEVAGFVHAFLLREVVYAFAISMVVGLIYGVMAVFMFPDMVNAANNQNNEALLTQYFLLLGVNQVMSLLPPLICVIMLFAQRERRTLQDMIADTVVIKMPR